MQYILLLLTGYYVSIALFLIPNFWLQKNRLIAEWIENDKKRENESSHPRRSFTCGWLRCSHRLSCSSSNHCIGSVFIKQCTYILLFPSLRSRILLTVSLFVCWFQPGLISQSTMFFSHNKPALVGLISPETNQQTGSVIESTHSFICVVGAHSFISRTREHTNTNSENNWFALSHLPYFLYG